MSKTAGHNREALAQFQVNFRDNPRMTDVSDLTANADQSLIVRYASEGLQRYPEDAPQRTFAL